jgi:hypothetical protein
MVRCDYLRDDDDNNTRCRLPATLFYKIMRLNHPTRFVNLNASRHPVYCARCDLHPMVMRKNIGEETVDRATYIIGSVQEA